MARRERDVLNDFANAEVSMYVMSLGECWDQIDLLKALVIKNLRVRRGLSLREIGETCRAFFGDWESDADEHYGMVFCRLASHQLGEHYLRGEWAEVVKESFPCTMDIDGDIEQALQWRDALKREK